MDSKEAMIDIDYNFRTDTPPGYDHDSFSPTLKTYHQKLWSKELPNGEIMDLKVEGPPYTLTWKDFRLSSDAIIIEMRYVRIQNILDQVRELVDDYDAYYEGLLRRSYTIGGEVIFPKHQNSMNQIRGTNSKITDRWDLTMECIRRYYKGEDSPLYETMLRDKDFFDLFVDFKGYVDFFLLQDCVSNDYSTVDIWFGDASFEESGLPKTVEDYFDLIKKEHIFLEKRNQRIKEYSEENGL